MRHHSHEQTTCVCNKRHVSAEKRKIHLTKQVEFTDRMPVNLLEPKCRENPRRSKVYLHLAKHLSWRTGDPKSPWKKKHLPPFCWITSIKWTNPANNYSFYVDIKTVFHLLSTGSSNFSNNVMLGNVEFWHVGNGDVANPRNIKDIS